MSDNDETVQVKFRLPRQIRERMQLKADTMGLSDSKYLEGLIQRDLDILPENIENPTTHTGTTVPGGVSPEEHHFVLELAHQAHQKWRSLHGEEWFREKQMTEFLHPHMEKISQFRVKAGLFEESDPITSLHTLAEKLGQRPLARLGNRTPQDITQAYDTVAEYRPPTVSEFASKLGLTERQFSNMISIMRYETGQPLELVSEREADRLDMARQRGILLERLKEYFAGEPRKCEDHNTTLKIVGISRDGLPEWRCGACGTNRLFTVERGIVEQLRAEIAGE